MFEPSHKYRIPLDYLLMTRVSQQEKKDDKNRDRLDVYMRALDFRQQLGTD